MTSSLPLSFRQMAGIPASSVSTSSGGVALVVIDPQNSYAKGAPLEISNVEASQKVIGQLVEKFRSAKAPVVWVQHSAGDGAPVFNPQNESFDFMGDVRPKDGETQIVKNAPSCFTGTEFHHTLQKRGIKQLVLVGYMAHVCVTGTARSAMEHGYDTVVVKDAIGDRHIPSLDGTQVTKAETLVDIVCTELADFFATILRSNEIKA